MLDVIITISQDTPPEWVQQACDSVGAAAQEAGFPVNRVLESGVPGHIGRAMRAGLLRGSQPYVTWVDDDDYVLPMAFACLAKHLETGAPAICAREVQLLNNGREVQCTQRHHLTAWRRDFLERQPLLEHPAYPLVPLFRAVKDTAIDEYSWVYMRRIRRSGGMRLRGMYGFGC